MQSVNRRIFAAAITVGAMNGVVMVVAVLRDLLFAYRFGTSAIIDAFLMGLIVPTMAVQLVGASLGLAVVPEMIHLRGQSDRSKSAAFSSSASAVGLAFLLLLTIVLLLFQHPLLKFLTAGFDGPRARLTSFFLLGFLPSIILQGWSAILGGFLNANNRFAVSALAPLFRPLSLCVTLFFDWGTNSAWALLLAYLAGSCIEATWITVAAVRGGISIRPRWVGLTEPLQRVLRESGMAFLGTGVLSAAILADQYLASLADVGGVAAYNYGGKITSVLIGAGALPLGVAVLPHFSLQIRAGNWKEFRQTLIVWSGVVGSLATVAAALLWSLSHELVQLMFQRGAFSSRDTELVAQIQKFLALQLPFYLCGILYVRALTSLQRNGLVVLVALTNAAVNIVGSLLLLGSFGVLGIALAVSGGYALASIIACLLILVLSVKRATITTHSAA